MIVPELEKPKDQWCQHFGRGRGCTIYDQRPHSCRVFACEWIWDSSLGEEWKPNKCKMVIEAKEMKFAVHVDPSAHQPWRAEPYFSQLTGIAERGIAHGLKVIVIERGHWILILPDHGVVDLGIVGPDDRMWVGQVLTANGPRWDARLVRPGPAGKEEAPPKGG
jgi:hypothetical protein